MDTIRCAHAAPRTCMKSREPRGVPGCGPALFPLLRALPVPRAGSVERALHEQEASLGRSPASFTGSAQCCGDPGRVTPKGTARPEQVVAALGTCRVVLGASWSRLLVSRWHLLPR